MSKEIYKFYWLNGNIKHTIQFDGIGRIHKWMNENGSLHSEHYWLYSKRVSKEEYRKHILIESLACLK